MSRKNVYAIHISDKRLAFGILYQDFLWLNNKILTQLKTGKKFEQTLHKRRNANGKYTNENMPNIIVIE